MLETLRKFAETYHLTTWAAAWISIACLISAMLAAREFFAWYFKINRLEKQILRMGDQIHELENSIRLLVAHQSSATEMQVNLTEEQAPSPLFANQKEPSHKAKTETGPAPTHFPISH